jgi:hypothetical protein
MDDDAYVLPHRVDPSVDFTFGSRVLAEQEEVQPISESVNAILQACIHVHVCALRVDHKLAGHGINAGPPSIRV